MTRLMDSPTSSTESEDNLRPLAPPLPPISFTDLRMWLIGHTEYDWAAAYRLLTRHYFLPHSEAIWALASATSLAREKLRSDG